MLEFAQRYFEDDYTAILRVLLSIAAIWVPLFLAFVVQRFVLLRQHQLANIEPLGALQDELRDYRRAISGLASDLGSTARTKGIELDFKRSFEEQRWDPNSWKDEHASAKHYILAFHAFGERWYAQQEYAHGGGLFTYDAFEDLFAALEVCSGFFSREKYYRPVFESLGIDKMRMCSERVNFDVVASLRTMTDDTRSMEFWENLVDQAYELMLRMRPLYRTLLTPFPTLMLTYSLVLGGIGILVPLAILAIDLPKVFEFYGTYAATAAFAAVLFLNLNELRHHLKSPLLQTD